MRSSARPGRDGQGGHELGVPVAGDDLSRHGVDLEAQLAADVLLHAWVDGRVRTHGPADPADGRVFGGLVEAGHGAVKLGHPPGGLEAERDRLGDDAMRPAGHQRAAVPDRQLGRSLAHGGQFLTDEPSRFDDLDGHAGVIEVLARHAQVHVACFRLPDRLVQDGEKRNHVVADA